MTDLPNPSQVYASSYASTGPMTMQPTGIGGDMPQFITHPAQIGTVPLYRATLPQPTMGSGPVPMCQPGQSGPALPHTMVTMVPNPGPMAPAGQIRFAGQMVQQVIQSQNSTSLGFKRLLTEMKARQFDAIRFAAYRTASKLRYIQQRTLFGMVDLWRVVDTFRDFGLHQITEHNATLDYASTSRLLARIYSHLNGALDPNSGKPPRTLDVNAIHKAVDLLLGWLAYALDICATGRLTVTGLKIALSVLTNAKPAEKFRYHFTLLSDPSGALIPAKFEAYLQDLLKLPVSVFEGPNFFYTPQAAQALLSGRSKNILIEEFLDRMLADPGSQLLVWLTIFHRLAAVENVRHNVRCEVCKREPMWGLRYKCTRCPHYNLCQDCFWTGATTDQHTNAHDVKEYSSSSKSHSRQFGHSLRKSFHLSRLTGSTTQSGSAGSTDSTSLVTTGSQRHISTGQVFKRAPLGSIFEWNSAPGSVDANGFTKNGSIMSPPGTNTSMDAGGPGQLAYRPQMPVSAVRSPLPHRRLQQLNPLFLSAPTNPTVQQFPNSNVMMTQSPIYAPGQLASVPTYPSEQPAVRLTNPSSNPMVPMGYNPIKVRAPNILDGERHANLMSPAGGVDPRQMLLNSAVPQPIMNSPGYMMSAPMYRQTTDSLSSTTPSEPWSTSVTTTNSMVPSSNQPVEQRQTFQSNMVNSTSSAIRNADVKCREEHQLIARYAAQLAAASAFNAEFEKFGDVADSPHTQKQLIAELQAKNRKILKEIERLRVEQQKQAAIIASARGDGTAGVKGDGSKELDLLHDCALSPNTLAQLNRSEGQSTGSGGASGAGGVGVGGIAGGGGGTGGGSSTSSGENPKLVTELHALRQRKDELETRMSNLQRNRTELMLQLETLVRLLSMTSGPIQTSRPRQQSLDMTDSIIPDLSPAGLLPSTPSLSGRIRHQSRLGSKPPENPPRRSSSLCQTSTDRSILDRERFGTRTAEDSKGSERKLSSNNTPLDARSGLSKYTDSSFLRAELIRKSLLSPTSDSHSDSSALRYRSNDVTAVLTDKPSSTPSTTCDSLLEKFEYLLKKTDSSQTASKRTLGTSRSGLRQHSGFNSYGQTLHGNGNSGNHTDSGSEAYLYSDPEMGYSGSALSSARREAANRSKPLLSRSRGGEDGGKPRLGTTYSDNYEYAGVISNESSTVSSGMGANRSAESTASEVVAAPKQLTSGSEKERVV